MKRELFHVLEEQWASIPEVGDFRNRKQRGFGRYDTETAIPDSILNMNRNNAAFNNQMDQNVQDGISTPAGDLDMVRFGEARNQIMDVKSKQVAKTA